MNENKQIQAVIFDLDGTLVDSMGIWSEVDYEFLKKRNIDVPADLFDGVESGFNLVGLAEHFKARFHLADTTESIIQEWTDLVYEHYQHQIPLKDGVIPVMDYLRDRCIPLAIGTSNSLLLTQTVLERHGLFGLFSEVVTSSDVEKGKPFPDVYLKTADKLNLSPEHCLVIEDSLAGVLAAKSAGMKVIVIHDVHSDHERPQLIQNADHYAYSYQEVHDILQTYL